MKQVLAGFGLKQVQWTLLMFFLVLIPLTLWGRRWRSAQPVPDGATAATYGITQPTEWNERSARADETQVTSSQPGRER